MPLPAKVGCTISLLALGLAVLISAQGADPSDGTAVPIPPLRAIGAIHPRISPDGLSIAFSYQGAIWRVARDGGAMRRLTAGPGYDDEPAWSADGKRIAYLSDGEVRVLDPESGAAVELPAEVRTGVRASGSLNFHSDGKRLLGVFRVIARGGQPGRSAGLAWVDLETGCTTPLLDPPRAVKAWCLSPDGERVAIATDQDRPGEQDGNNGPRMDVWLAPAAGGEPARLFTWRSRVFAMAWGAGELFFSTDLGGAHNDIWKVSLADPSRAQKLTSGQADEDGPSVAGGGPAGGPWLVHTDNREGATALVLRDLESGDERTLSIVSIDFGKPAGVLRLEVLEKGTGRPLTARVSIEAWGEKFHAPPGALHRVHGGLGHFYAGERAELSVPAGKYVVRAFRGIEYRAARAELEVGAGQAASVQLELERWTDPPSRSWYSGESHIHANYGYGAWYNTPRTVRLQVEGEGLNLSNLVVANSDTDGVFDREHFRGEPDPVSSADTVLYWNEEFRATLWGHMTLYNLKQLVEPIFTGFKDTTNPWDAPTNADVADAAHLQGGHVTFTHPASNAADPFAGAYSAKSLPVDVALGKIDSLDINFTLDAAVPLWHRLLNCGFRIPASAGTDCFLNRIQSQLPGWARAYVKVEGPFSYGEWVKGLHAGRSFVTSGPILELLAAEKGLGETLTLEAARSVSVKAAAVYRAPLNRVELVLNGEVAAAGTLLPDRLQGAIDQAVRLEKSGWLGLRAFAEDGTQAHTSPIYIEVGGQPAASCKDAEYFLAWIDRLDAMVKERARVPGPELVLRVQRLLEDARAVYRGIAARGEQ